MGVGGSRWTGENRFAPAPQNGLLVPTPSAFPSQPPNLADDTWGGNLLGTWSGSEIQVPPCAQGPLPPLPMLSKVADPFLGQGLSALALLVFGVQEFFLRGSALCIVGR